MISFKYEQSILSKNPDGCFDERPENETEQNALRLLLLPAKVIERLLHRLRNSLFEFSWIESEELSIENMDCSGVMRHTQLFSGIASAVVRW